MHKYTDKYTLEDVGLSINNLNSKKSLLQIAKFILAIFAIIFLFMTQISLSGCSFFDKHIRFNQTISAETLKDPAFLYGIYTATNHPDQTEATKMWIDAILYGTNIIESKLYSLTDDTLNELYLIAIKHATNEIKDPIVKTGFLSVLSQIRFQIKPENSLAIGLPKPSYTFDRKQIEKILNAILSGMEYGQSISKPIQI